VRVSSGLFVGDWLASGRGDLALKFRDQRIDFFLAVLVLEGGLAETTRFSAAGADVLWYACPGRLATVIRCRQLGPM
jgi:hypothetical protein